LPLSFTVHNMAAPDLADDRRRTASGRLKMILVLAVCAAPVIASYLTYFVIRPEGRTNHGELISPTHTLPPALELRGMDGTPVAAASLRGQWLLVTVGPSACDAACEKRLFMQRQLREMLGRERTRLDKIWLLTDAGDPAPALRAAVDAAPPVQLLRADRAALARWLTPAPGQALEDHLYLVDPMGEWMMRMPADPDPARVKRDLERVLRASASWDLPGR
jgi:hypothetical protein